MDRASDYGSEGWGFDSLRAHFRTCTRIGATVRDGNDVGMGDCETEFRGSSNNYKSIPHQFAESWAPVLWLFSF